MGIPTSAYQDSAIAEVAAMIGANDEPEDDDDEGTSSGGGTVEMVDPLQFRVGG